MFTDAHQGLALALVLHLAWAPSGRLAENRRRRLHWSQYASVMAQERADACKAVLEALGRDRPQLPYAYVTLRYHFTDSRRRDVDGLVQRSKVLLDALVSTGILPDDGPEHLRGLYIPAATTGESDGVVVELWSES